MSIYLNEFKNALPISEQEAFILGQRANFSDCAAFVCSLKNPKNYVFWATLDRTYHVNSTITFSLDSKTTSKCARIKISQVDSFCGGCHLSGIEGSPSLFKNILNTAIKFAKICGYSSLTYITNQYQEDASKALREAGFVMVGEPFKNSRTGSMCRYWMLSDLQLYKFNQV